MESELSVREVLTKEYLGVSESDAVRDVVRLMREERTGCALVIRGSEPVGILTEWDVLGVVADDDDPSTTTAGDVMSAPVLTVDPQTPLTDAADTMTRENIRNLVVKDDDGVVGICTQRDVIVAAGSFRAATAPSRTPASPSEENGSPVAREASTAVDGEMVTNGADEYSSQGVCEACGTLADSLFESNGRLLCSNCRSV